MCLPIRAKLTLAPGFPVIGGLERGFPNVRWITATVDELIGPGDVE